MTTNTNEHKVLCKDCNGTGVNYFVLDDIAKRLAKQYTRIFKIDDIHFVDKFYNDFLEDAEDEPEAMCKTCNGTGNGKYKWIENAVDRMNAYNAICLKIDEHYEKKRMTY